MSRDTPVQAPADLGTIDLAEIKARYLNAVELARDCPWDFSADEDLRAIVVEDHTNLIAAVEALRGRVAELEPIVKDGVRRAENCMNWQARAEAAEAGRAELAGALEKIAQWQREKCETANAEILFMLLDNKVGIALAALTRLDALKKGG